MKNRHFVYVTDFDRWKWDLLSDENIFEYFLFSAYKILFVVDDSDRLYGIITLGDFIKSSDDIKKAVNKNFLFVRKDEEEHMFSSAREIFDQHGMESYLPVIDQEDKMTGFLMDLELLRKKDALYEQNLTELERKISLLKKSHYLKKEMEAFYEVLADTTIFFRKSKGLRKIFSLFDGRIRGRVLSDQEYLKKLSKWRKNRDHLTDEEKTELIFDFDCRNIGALAEKAGIASVYSLEKFMNEFTALTENEEFSRAIRMTHNSAYSLADFISDHDMKHLEFPANRLLSKYLYDYMKEQQIPFSLTYFNNIAVMHASFPVSGMRGSTQDAIGLSSCDLSEQLLLSRMLKKRRIMVLNMKNASDVNITEGEKRRIESYGVAEKLIIDKDMHALKLLYGDDCGNKSPYEYAEELSYSFPVKRRFENDLVINADYKSTYVNIENGIRRTCYQPALYTNTIYFFGPCIALGPYVEDKHTIASQLARKLLKDQYAYRIVNLGMLASNNSSEMLERIDFQENDIVINLFYIGKGKKFEEQLKDIMDPSDAFNRILDREDMFFDKSVHCNRKGNEVYAEAIYEYIKPALKKAKTDSLKKNHVYDVFRTNLADLHLYDIPEYLKMLKQEKQKVPKEAQAIGSIVMNCNPFTLGHQYLVQYALQYCDYLFVFVVQEDKSYFSFEDRFAIAKDHCRQYSNVSVIPSGKMIASDLTFPEYFRRESVRDRMEVTADLKITPVHDFRLFASYIAPVLGIKKRFVAEEPFDSVTEQYNENMKKVLSALGLEVVEIKRKALEDGEVISASKVRRMYQKGEYLKMKKMLPQSTYHYLMRNLPGDIHEN